MKKIRKTITAIKIPLIAGLFMVFVFLLTCQRFEPEGFFNVNTGAVSGITGNSALAGGEVTDEGGSHVTARGVCWSTSSEPAISDSRTQNGTGTGSYSSTLTGLSANTTYFYRAYATNSRGTTYGDEQSFTTTSTSVTGVTDIDGNAYQTVYIGEQHWMAGNLKTTRYADGSAIPLVEGSTDWINLTADDKAYCWCENSTTNRDTYGGLYTWAAAMNGAASSDANPSGVQGVCPDGWHLPSDKEWKELEMFLGMSQEEADDTQWRGTDEGGKLKETGTTFWSNPNTGANNESGFTALPGGARYTDGLFQSMGQRAYFWTSTESNATYAWGRFLTYENEDVFRDGHYEGKDAGFSVRCVEDGGSSLTTPTVSTESITRITGNSATGGGEVTSDGGNEVSARGVCWSTSSTPTTSDDTTLNGGGTGKFISNITGLDPVTTYYVRAYATNGVGTSYGEELSFTTDEPDITGQTGTLTDYDGNTYDWIGIGSQAWMAENLKTTHYGDGTEIPLVEGGTEWDNLTATDRAYSWYDNSTTNKEIFGGLYTWTAAMNGAASSNANPSDVQGVCPDGWHLPSDAEWKKLEMFLGMTQAVADGTGSRGTIEGGKLKEVGITHWNSPNTEASNESGFTALPGGYRTYSGSFSYQGNYASFWTATESDATLALGRYLGYDYSQVYRDYYEKDYGFSVRCVRGEGASLTIPSVSTASINNITENSASGGGEITSDSGDPVTVRGICWSTSQSPSLENNEGYTDDGNGTGTFESSLTGLDPNTTYYVRAYATNNAGTGYGDEVSFVTEFEYTGTVTDIDGNVYNTIQIEDQLWMAENLKTTKYADGSSITNVEGASEWVALSVDDKAYCWYENSTTNRDAYGGLYNWAAAMNGASTSDANPSGVQGVCPDGWHLPSDVEWKELEMNLGMSQEDADLFDKVTRGSDEGGKMKEAGITRWNSPNTGATNESGFSALPAGDRNGGDGLFDAMNIAARFWTATEDAGELDDAWSRNLVYNIADVRRYNFHQKKHGFSVRCLRD